MAKRVILDHEHSEVIEIGKCFTDQIYAFADQDRDIFFLTKSDNAEEQFSWSCLGRMTFWSQSYSDMRQAITDVITIDGLEVLTFNDDVEFIAWAQNIITMREEEE